MIDRLQDTFSSGFVAGLVAVFTLFLGQPLVSPAAGADSRDVASLTDQHIRVFEAKAAQDPARVEVRNRLARLYIQKSRENGDASYFTRAEKLLTKSLELEPANVDTLGLQAWLSLYKHEFQEAAAWAEKARNRRPNESWNYGVLSDAYLEMGEYAKAVSYTQQMVDLRPDQGSYSRAAHFRSLHGDSEGAVELWLMAIRAGTHTGEYTAWCKVELGDEYFNHGKFREAEEAYTGALQSFPGYHRGLAGMAKVREAAQQWKEAADFYQHAIGVVPYPQYVSALGDVYREMGQPENAEQQYQLVEHIAKLDRLNKVLYNRELALFYADHGRNLDEALRLAHKELEIRKDIYTYDILAWASYQNHRYTEAWKAVKTAMKLGTQDARILFHAGMIARALGHRKEAKAYLSQALAINPAFHPTHRKTAQQILERLE
ncbi:MAG TPA: tetratricopeptide repeat protein [Nitrospiraceae bacterium]|nr:tetratricopeptide repeat protein [Nitrospiraceae bacterium]